MQCSVADYSSSCCVIDVNYVINCAETILLRWSMQFLKSGWTFLLLRRTSKSTCLVRLICYWIFTMQHIVCKC